jgi:hypothetical protein
MSKIILPIIALTLIAGAAEAHGRQSAPAPVAHVQAQVGNHGQVANVGVTVGGSSSHGNQGGLLNVKADVLGNGRSNSGLLNVQASVGGSSNHGSQQGGLLNLNANLLGGGRNSGLASINLGLLSGGVGGHGDNGGW